MKRRNEEDYEDYLEMDEKKICNEEYMKSAEDVLSLYDDYDRTDVTDDQIVACISRNIKYSGTTDMIADGIVNNIRELIYNSLRSYHLGNKNLEKMVLKQIADYLWYHFWFVRQRAMQYEREIMCDRGLIRK